MAAAAVENCIQVFGTAVTRAMMTDDNERWRVCLASEDVLVTCTIDRVARAVAVRWSVHGG